MSKSFALKRKILNADFEKWVIILNIENEYKSIIKKSIEIKIKMIHLSSNLNVKYNTIFRKPILDYSTKQFDLIKYISNIKIDSCENIILLRYILRISLSYLKCLYNKFLDMRKVLYTKIRSKYKKRKLLYNLIDLTINLKRINIIFTREFKENNNLIKLCDLEIDLSNNDKSDNEIIRYLNNTISKILVIDL